MGDKGGRKQGLEAGHVQSCEAIRKYGIYGKDRGLVFGFSLFCLCFLWGGEGLECDRNTRCRVNKISRELLIKLFLRGFYR